jgi:NAD dependent epimerase/dehydratase family enzyme
MVMGDGKDGAFHTLAGLAKRGLGGKAGSGQQFMSWIHETDFVRAVKWLIEKPVSGPVNLAAPEPLPQAEFMAELRRACGGGFGLPAPKALLGVATFFMDTESELILKSRRVVPGVLLKKGFSFEYPKWAEAAAELCARHKTK